MFPSCGRTAATISDRVQGTEMDCSRTGQTLSLKMRLESRDGRKGTREARYDRPDLTPHTRCGPLVFDVDVEMSSSSLSKVVESGV